jgi:membrane protein implicated in regulation of membrane protease activity
MEAPLAVLRIAISLVGILVILSGVIWIGQGSGLFPYPASSFMINQSPWIWRGALTAIAGLLILWAARRFLR